MRKYRNNGPTFSEPTVRNQRRMAPLAEQTAVDAEKTRRSLELFQSEGPATLMDDILRQR
jgi:hypothetical protein